jgi:predicted glutamine amidotransferase
MCFNSVIINPKARKLLSDEREAIMRVFDIEAKSNSHGFAAYGVINDREYLSRSLVKEEVFNTINNVLRERFRLLHVHFRYRTTGSISEGNVHMFKIGDQNKYYYVSHNGHVREYMSYHDGDWYCDDWIKIHDSWYCRRYRSMRTNDKAKDKDNKDVDDKSDTRALVENKEFQEHVLKNDLERLSKLLDEKGFYGVMFMTNKDEVIAVSKDKSIKVYLWNDLIILSNDEIYLPIRDKEIFGFIFRRNVPRADFRDQIIHYDLRQYKIVKRIRFEDKRLKGRSILIDADADRELEEFNKKYDKYYVAEDGWYWT